jgi:hypothetical protein
MAASAGPAAGVDLAYEATLLWLTQQYDASLQTLHKLESMGEGDVKVCIAGP